MCSFLYVVLILLACVSKTLAQADPAALQPTVLEASVSVAGLPVQGVATSAGSIPPAVPVVPRQDAAAIVAQQCQGVPATDSYTQAWSCTGTECTATCVPGAKAPYGPPKAVCTAGTWQPAGPGCLAGVHLFACKCNVWVSRVTKQCLHKHACSETMQTRCSTT